MKSFLAFTTVLFLVSPSAFAKTSFYCADENQDIQFTQDQALLSLDGKTVSYKALPNPTKTLRTYANLEIQVDIQVQNSEVVSTSKKLVGLCVDGVQKVQITTQTQDSVIVNIDDMQEISVPVTCEIKKSDLEYCN